MESKTLRPKDWIKDLWELDPEDEENNGLLNEDLIVWMRTAAFPNFRKLYRKIDHKDDFKDGLPAGNYTFHIDYSKLIFYSTHPSCKKNHCVFLHS